MERASSTRWAPPTSSTPIPTVEDPREKIGFELLEELDLRKRDDDLRNDRRAAAAPERRREPLRVQQPPRACPKPRSTRRATGGSSSTSSTPTSIRRCRRPIRRWSTRSTACRSAAFLKDAALQRKVYGTHRRPNRRGSAGKRSSPLLGRVRHDARAKRRRITASTSSLPSSAARSSIRAATRSSRSASPSASRATTRARSRQARGRCASNARVTPSP